LLASFPLVHVPAHHIYPIKQCSKFHFHMYKEASLVIMTLAHLVHSFSVHETPALALLLRTVFSVMGIWCPMAVYMIYFVQLLLCRVNQNMACNSQQYTEGINTGITEGYGFYSQWGHWIFQLT
jgi:hypothetical protein